VDYSWIYGVGPASRWVSAGRPPQRAAGLHGLRRV